MNRLIVVAVCAGLVHSPFVAAAPPEYSLIDIHSDQPVTTPGVGHLTNSVAEAISHTGCSVCGMENGNLQSPVFIWNYPVMPTPVDQDSSTSKTWRFRDVNDDGIAVGSSLFAQTEFDDPYYWDGSGSLSYLLTSTATHGRAQGINNNGTIVGCIFDGTLCGTNSWLPVIWASPSTSGNPTAIEQVPGALNNINAAGNQVVGWTWGNAGNPATYFYRAATWIYSSSWTRTNLDDLSGDNHAFAYALNNNGLIVGVSASDSQAVCTIANVRAVYWDPTSMTPQAAVEIPGLGSDTRSWAYSVNDSDSIVGWSDAGSEASRRAFIYELGGSIYDLNDYIPYDDTNWELIEAHDINHAGWIVGVGLYDDGIVSEKRAFLLIPEPRCEGDLNGDGEVDGGDLGLLLSNWDADCNAAGDMNEDGTVDGADLGLLLDAWGPCGDELSEGTTPQELMIEFGYDTMEEFVEWLLAMEFPAMKAWLEMMLSE